LVQQALKQIATQALSLTPNGYFITDISEKSRCVDDNKQWRPVPQSTPVDFRGLANALETEIHPDICTFYSSFWSGSLETTSQEGQVSLIQMWNQDDFDRLIENFIGHALMKRQQKLPLTLFFATTEPDSELFLSLDNATGEVLLEEPARPPKKIVDNDLSTFLNRLTPVLGSPDIY
jgi:SecY interacting protein Syd|tara:strand:+ start:781 stop:1311 length:531 start_codon:yes stop_codon:yes gene_type:complete